MFLSLWLIFEYLRNGIVKTKWIKWWRIFVYRKSFISHEELRHAVVWSHLSHPQTVLDGKVLSALQCKPIYYTRFIHALFNVHCRSTVLKTIPSATSSFTDEMCRTRGWYPKARIFSFLALWRHLASRQLYQMSLTSTVLSWSGC